MRQGNNELKGVTKPDLMTRLLYIQVNHSKGQFWIYENYPKMITSWAACTLERCSQIVKTISKPDNNIKDNYNNNYNRCQQASDEKYAK